MFIPCRFMVYAYNSRYRLSFPYGQRFSVYSDTYPGCIPFGTDTVASRIRAPVSHLRYPAPSVHVTVKQLTPSRNRSVCYHLLHIDRRLCSHSYRYRGVVDNRTLISLRTRIPVPTNEGTIGRAEVFASSNLSVWLFRNRPTAIVTFLPAPSFDGYTFPSLYSPFYARKRQPSENAPCQA